VPKIAARSRHKLSPADCSRMPEVYEVYEVHGRVVSSISNSVVDFEELSGSLQGRLRVSTTATRRASRPLKGQ